MTKQQSAINIEVFLETEQIETAFENAEIKFSAAKMEKVKEMLNEVDIDAKERLENALIEFIEEMIADEWGEE